MHVVLAFHAQVFSLTSEILETMEVNGIGVVFKTLNGYI